MPFTAQNGRSSNGGIGMGINQYIATKKSRMNEVVFNLIFWVLYFLYQWFGLASLYGDLNGYFINACLALPVSLSFSVLVVHVFFRRGRVAFWVWTLLVSGALLLIRRYFNYYIIYPRYFPAALQLPLYAPGKFLVDAVHLYAVTGLYALYYFVGYWYQERHRVQELLQRQTLAELELLKAQVQPHFVFNTLNNIYGTALRTSPETAALIAHLSGFLDYSLYDASRERVSLRAELDYIHHYVELQKNRYGKRLEADIQVAGDVDGVVLAPLLLLPLVENCFKHGVANSVQQSWVRIVVQQEGDQVTFRIENSRDEGKVKPGGIGLANVRKRLELIYPGRHAMKIMEDVNAYLVVLTIQNDVHDQMSDS